jgi:hypothetical protein
MRVCVVWVCANTSRPTASRSGENHHLGENTSAVLISAWWRTIAWRFAVSCLLGRVRHEGCCGHIIILTRSSSALLQNDFNWESRVSSLHGSAVCVRCGGGVCGAECSPLHCGGAIVPHKRWLRRGRKPLAPRKLHARFTTRHSCFASGLCVLLVWAWVWIWMGGCGCV